MKNYILFIIGSMLFQFFIGIVIYQIGFDHGRKANVNDIIMNSCMHGKPISYGSDLYDIICILHQNQPE